MIEIKRTYDPARGLRDVEQLSGYVFSPESFAHKFTVARSDEYGFEGTVSGRFLRADGLKIVIADVETAGIDPDGSAYVILTPECYQVPGRFLFLMLHTINSEQSVIYAATSSVLDAEGTGEQIAERSALTLEEQLRRVMVKANNVALFAQNVGDIESQVAEYGANTEGILAALAEAEIRPLNKPNLLKYQPEGVSVKIPNGPVVVKYATVPAEDATAAAEPIVLTFTDAAFEAGMVLHYVMSRVFAVTTMDMVSAVVTDGSATVTIAARSGAHEEVCNLDLVFCHQQTAVLPYGELSATYGPGPWLNSTSNMYHGVENDEISERVVDLGTDAVTDSDGAEYTRAVAFTVANAPAQGYNNADLLVFNHGTDGGTWTRQDGSTYTYRPSGILDLEEGEVYTLSCWARITDGTKARLYMGYGHNASGYSSTGYDGNHNYIDIENTGWQRVSFAFVYHATASYTAAGANPYTVTVEHKKRVAVGVCRKYTGTVQLTGFRLTKGGLYGSDSIDTLKAQLTALTARVAALESNS